MFDGAIKEGPAKGTNKDYIKFLEREKSKLKSFKNSTKSKTVTDLLQDETASTEFVREEIKRFIVKSVVDPRNKERVGGLQAQAAGKFLGL